jgi:flagellin-like hook-associated protein FlgL
MVDADYAEEMADLVREQILRESGLIVMNQMQLNLRLILKLLPGN